MKSIATGILAACLATASAAESHLDPDLPSYEPVSGVRTVPLSTDGGDFYDATYDHALSGDYPLARFLLVYVNKKPSEPLPKAPLEFLKFVLSKEGQAIVEKDGYFPMPAELAEQVVSSLAK